MEVLIFMKNYGYGLDGIHQLRLPIMSYGDYRVIFLYAILKTSRNISASTKDKNSKYPGNPGKGAFLCFKSHILKRLKKSGT